MAKPAHPFTNECIEIRDRSAWYVGKIILPRGAAWYSTPASLPNSLVLARARVIRTRSVEIETLRPSAVSLARTRDVDVHAIWSSIVIAIEIRLDPQLLANPRRRVSSNAGNDLRHAVTKVGAAFGAVCPPATLAIEESTIMPANETRSPRGARKPET